MGESAINPRVGAVKKLANLKMFFYLHRNKQLNYNMYIQ